MKIQLDLDGYLINLTINNDDICLNFDQRWLYRPIQNKKILWDTPFDQQFKFQSKIDKIVEKYLNNLVFQ